MMKKVAVIMGSDSDFPVVTKAVLKLKEFGVPRDQGGLEAEGIRCSV